jgi:hypothetical protein
MRSLVSLMIVALGLPTQAAVLCVSRMGAVHVRDACRSRETPANPATLGLQGPPGPPGPGLTVKDANGVLVGTVVEEAHAGDVDVRTSAVGDILGVSQITPTPFIHLMQVARVVNGTALRFTVSPAGFVNTGPELGYIVAFDGPSCTGQAYFDVGSPGSSLTIPRFLESAWINGTTLYYRPHGPASTAAMQRSILTFPVDASQSCPFGTTDFIAPAGRCCTDGSTYAIEGVSLTVLDIASLGLVPPFHVETP